MNCPNCEELQRTIDAVKAELEAAAIRRDLGVTALELADAERRGWEACREAAAATIDSLVTGGNLGDVSRARLIAVGLRIRSLQSPQPADEPKGER